MVSFWPWKGDDTSPASFEKSLSTVSVKITRLSASLDSCRQQSRRLKALWTLYTSFAYLLYLMIIGLVVGFRNCGVYEYTGLAAGPVVIYTVRLALSTYYDYRISSLQSQVNEVQKKRDNLITKLKAATKYDSTQQLIEKYGGTPARPKQKSSANQRKPSSDNKGSTDQRGGQGRPTLVPPPTANIQYRQPSGPLSAPNTPNRSTPVTPGPNPPFTAAATTPPWAQNPQRQYTDTLSPDDSASFAPNAFPAPTHYANSYPDGGPKWYDRLLDVLLGEDETNPKSRLALICKNCRLVNGQAPPGVKRLEDVGKWRCSSCGVMNGEEDEAKRLVEKFRGQEMGIVDSPVAEEAESTRVKGKLDEEPVIVEREEEDEQSDVTQYSGDEGKKGMETRSSKAKKKQ